MLVLMTDADEVDETNVSLLVRVDDGDGYSVGDPKVAVVTIEDNDKPPAPTGLRANGDLDDDDNVTLRWNAVSGATGYQVRYAKETCKRYTTTILVLVDDEVEEREVERAKCTEGTWSRPVEAATNEFALGGLTEETLYRVEVRTVIAETSVWSDFALVFPTNTPPGGADEVATAPFHGYLGKDGRGSHEFRYVLCEDTIPAGLDTTAQDMKNAVDEWEDTVIWDRSGANIIATTSHNLPAGEGCRVDRLPLPDGRFEVKFVSNNTIRNACDPLKIRGSGPPGCWRSINWTNIFVDLTDDRFDTSDLSIQGIRVRGT